MVLLIILALVPRPAPFTAVTSKVYFVNGSRLVAVNAKFELETLKYSLDSKHLEILSSYLIMMPFAFSGGCHVSLMDDEPVTNATIFLGASATNKT